jgi:hypothetical protein
MPVNPVGQIICNHPRHADGRCQGAGIRELRKETPMPYERRVTVDGGKYTFFVPEGDWKIHVLRHGEPWVVLETASKAIWSLIAELIDARELAADVESWRRHRRPDDGGEPDLDLIRAHDRFRQERGQEPFKP